MTIHQSLRGGSWVNGAVFACASNRHRHRIRLRKEVGLRCALIIWRPQMTKYQPLRGGSWYDRPWTARASSRRRYEPSYRNGDGGFRCAMIVVWRHR